MKDEQILNKTFNFFTFHYFNIFSQVWVDAKMEFGGNWVSEGSSMVTSLYSDMRQTGNWPPLSADVFNTTGLDYFYFKNLQKSLLCLNDGIIVQLVTSKYIEKEYINCYKLRVLKKVSNLKFK
jgi:hypothetical protein